MPYRPADKVVETIFDKVNGYFIKIGHGPKSSPEIFSAGKKFLISAGGVNRGERSIIVARPITLFLNDHAGHLSQTFYLAGTGTDFKEWNNTGVYENFACAAGSVNIPDGYKATAENEIWQVYATGDSLLIAVHSEANFGLMSVFRNCDTTKLLAELTKANPNAEELKRIFRYPDGKIITYDVLAPKDKWVIVSSNGLSLDRDFDNWPLISGN